MSDTPSWVFFGRPDSAINRGYDWLRRRVNARLVRFLAAHLLSARALTAGDRQGKRIRVLEAGSGTAYASSLFRRSLDVGPCVCLDIDERALREAKRRDPALPAVVGDLTRMPFAEGSFELVFNSSTVEHLSEPSLAVREMHRVCEEGGRVFVGVPYRYGPLVIQRLLRRTKLGEWLGPVFSRKALDGLLRGQGLTPVEHIRYFLRFFVGSVGVKQAAVQRSGR